VNDSDKIELIKKLGGWERLVVFSGVLLTVPMFALLGVAVYSVATGRPDAPMAVLLSIISLLVLWAIIWGMLWIVSGFRAGGEIETSSDLRVKLEELRRDNERLKKQLTELKK
jgi:ABC-type Fe3+ transport system permease subunit